MDGLAPRSRRGPSSSADPSAAHRANPAFQSRRSDPARRSRWAATPNQLSNLGVGHPVRSQQHNPGPLRQTRPDRTRPRPGLQQLTLTRSKAQRLRAHPSFSRTSLSNYFRRAALVCVGIPVFGRRLLKTAPARYAPAGAPEETTALVRSACPSPGGERDLASKAPLAVGQRGSGAG